MDQREKKESQGGMKGFSLSALRGVAPKSQELRLEALRPLRS